MPFFLLYEKECSNITKIKEFIIYRGTVSLVQRIIHIFATIELSIQKETVTHIGARNFEVRLYIYIHEHALGTGRTAIAHFCAHRIARVTLFFAFQHNLRVYTYIYLYISRVTETEIIGEN